MGKPAGGRDIDEIDDGEEVVLGKDKDTGDGDRVQARHGDAPDENDIEVVLAEHDRQDTDGDPDGDDNVDDNTDDTIDPDGEDTNVEDTQASDDTAVRKDQDEDASYSEKVRKRIARERRARLEVEESLAAERVERDNLQRQNISLKKTLVETSLVNIDGMIAKAKDDLTKAVEAGETEKQVDAQTLLGDLQGRKREMERTKAALEQEATASAEGAKPENNPLTQRWIGKNKWFSDPNFKDAAAAVRGFDQAMVSEGFRPTSEAYYVELDKRINRNLPQLRAQLRKAGHVSAPRSEQTSHPARRGTGLPAQGASSTAAAGARRSAAGKRRVVLDKSDLENMEAFGMDPNDAKARVEYARNKIAAG